MKRKERKRKGRRKGVFASVCQVRGVPPLLLTPPGCFFPNAFKSPTCQGNRSLLGPYLGNISAEL